MFEKNKVVKDLNKNLKPSEESKEKERKKKQVKLDKLFRKKQKKLNFFDKIFKPVDENENQKI